MVLPYGRPVIDDDDIAAVVGVLKGQYLTTGPMVERFEAAFAAAVEAPHAVVCSSGTAALHLAAEAVGVGPGTTAIVPALTFVATANAPHLQGAEIVFADVDPATGLMTLDNLAAAIDFARSRFPDRRIAAIFPVHLNGQCAEMPAIAALARNHGAAVVEDACHALGGYQMSSHGPATPVGASAHSDVTCFSFHPVKTVAAGEGGCVTTRNPVLAERMRRFRNHGLVRDPKKFSLAEAFAPDGGHNPWFYEMPEPGLNYRASDIHCALALSQLGKLERFVAARARLVEYYRKQLVRFGNSIRAVPELTTGKPAWHLMVVCIAFGELGRCRSAVMRGLRGRGIGTQVHYIPVHRQPYYRSRYGLADLPGADAYYERALSLPLNAALTEADVDRVLSALAAELGLSKAQ